MPRTHNVKSSLHVKLSCWSATGGGRDGGGCQALLVRFYTGLKKRVDRQSPPPSPRGRRWGSARVQSRLGGRAR
jgi:hypothetical protein